MDFSKADIVAGPQDDDTANDFRCRLFDVTTTHQAHALPEVFSGQFVSIYSPVEVTFAFSRRSNAEVDRSVAATAAGASDKVGGKLAAGERRYILLDSISPASVANGPLYFVREAGSTSYVLMEISSR